MQCAAANGTGEMLWVSIADDGPGLNAEQARRIFEPFFTTRMRGTGLGMAISRRIIEAHGGTISARSVNGAQQASGTEVVLELPRARS
jgi:signal transduction histidine kinase